MTELPDEAIEAFFLGDAHDAWEHDAALVSLADQVLMGTTGPAPRPNPALAAFLGQPSAMLAAPLVATLPPWRPTTDPALRVVQLFRRLKLTAGIAVAAGVAAAALIVAGTTGTLPEPAMRAVSWAVDTVTPFELPEPAPAGGRGCVWSPGPARGARRG